jgi:hypothetical protein
MTILPTLRVPHPLQSHRKGWVIAQERDRFPLPGNNLSEVSQ